MSSKPAEQRFDPENRTFVTISGKVVRIRNVGPGAIDMKSRQFRKMYREPKPPKRTVDHGKGRTSEIEDVADPGYVQAQQEYENKVSMRVAEWILCTGIEVDVPETPEPGSVFEALLMPPEYGDADTTEVTNSFTSIEIKYAYINSLIDSGDYAFLMEVIVGAQGVTQLGIGQAAADFPSNG